MSLLINIVKIQLSIWVIGSHYSYNANNYVNKWFDIFVPQPLMGIGVGAVSLFMMFSSFFLYNSIQKFNVLETKSFLKQISLHWFKRYFQLRSVLIVQSLGYQQILYVIFNNGIGRDNYYNNVRDYKFWIHLFFPFFWPNRVWYSNNYISGSSWFNLELINIEFFQYVYYIIMYFIQKKIKVYKIGSVIQIIIGLILFLTNLTGISSLSYGIGYLLYDLRKLVVKKNICVKSKKLNVFVLIILFYLHEMLSRGCFVLNFIPMFLIILFDMTNFNQYSLPLQNEQEKKQNIGEKIVELYMKIQPSLYIVHHPFIREATPKYFDYIISYQNSIVLNYLVIYYIVLQWIVFSIPLYFIQKPIEQIPLYIVKKTKITIFQIFCLCVFIVLLFLQAFDVFGHQYIETPVLWKQNCTILLCFTKTY